VSSLRGARGVAGCGFALIVGGASVAWGQRALEGSISTVAAPIPFVADDGEIEWVRRFPHAGANFVRLELKVGSPLPATPFKVVVTGRDGVALSFTEATLPIDQEVWTPVIPGDEATVKVEGRPSGLRLTVTRVAFQVDRFRSLSLIGDDDRKEFWEVAKDKPALTAAGKAVAKLSIMTPGGPAGCTGFMLSSDLLLTNEHCIAEKRDCDNTWVLFGYQQDESGAVRLAEQVRCAALLDRDQDLDFALVRVNGTPGAAGAWGSLPLSPAAAAVGDVSMIQHPGGYPKRIAFPPHCKVLTLSDEGANPDKRVDLTHDCDCEDGSSGSPILNAALEVVALHRRGKTVLGPYADRNRAVRIQEICPRLRPFVPSLVCAPS
jgi:V8-like Glu-specific endopeptidase